MLMKEMLKTMSLNLMYEIHKPAISYYVVAFYKPAISDCILYCDKCNPYLKPACCSQNKVLLRNDDKLVMGFMTLAHFKKTNNHLRHVHRHRHCHCHRHCHDHHRPHHAQQPIWKSAQLVAGSIKPSRLLIRPAVDEAEPDSKR